MRLGLIGYSNNQGLGIMNRTLMEKFDFNVHLIIPAGDRGLNAELSLARNKILAKNWTPSDEELQKLFELCNVVIVVETDFKCDLFNKARAAGVRTVFIPMWEWFEWGKYTGADKYICTSRKTFNYLKSTAPESVHADSILALPWPVDTDLFKFKERCKGTANFEFIHNAGFGGLNRRKGTIEAVQAFNLLTETRARLHLRSQLPIESFTEISDILKTDKRILIDNRNWANNYEMYEHGDIYLYPARYDGQALVAEEAMACGFPVIVTDAEPMNEFTGDPTLKVRLKSNDKFKIHNHDVELNICDVQELAKVMTHCMYTDLSAISNQNRMIIEDYYSWNELYSDYEKAILG